MANSQELRPVPHHQASVSKHHHHAPAQTESSSARPIGLTTGDHGQIMDNADCCYGNQQAGSTSCALSPQNQSQAQTATARLGDNTAVGPHQSADAPPLIEDASYALASSELLHNPAFHTLTLRI